MSLTVKNPNLSPSLNEYDEAMLVDPDGNQIPLVAVVRPSAVDGSNNLHQKTVIPGVVSQVTARRGKPMVDVAGVGRVPVIALMDLSAGASAAVQQAGAKFQSSVRTATGSEESIAHGLGVAPSVVLLSIYDTNGVALPIAMSEGAHDATNLKVTVTASVKYKVIALA